MDNYIGNSNSSVNQRIKEKLVGREVYACISGIAEYILRKGYEDADAPFTIEDVENLYQYPEYYGTYASFQGGTEEQRDEEIARLKEMKESEAWEEMCSFDTIDEEIQALNELETEPQGVYEWWIVSGWLCEKLKQQGECVIEHENIWGRCCTGQAILLDGVISRIAADLGILEGQEHSWAE